LSLDSRRRRGPCCLSSFTRFLFTRTEPRFPLGALAIARPKARSATLLGDLAAPRLPWFSSVFPKANPGVLFQFRTLLVLSPVLHKCRRFFSGSSRFCSGFSTSSPGFHAGFLFPSASREARRQAVSRHQCCVSVFDELVRSREDCPCAAGCTCVCARSSRLVSSSCQPVCLLIAVSDLWRCAPLHALSSIFAQPLILDLRSPAESFLSSLACFLLSSQWSAQIL
jgi:hypothetical protein